MLRLMRIDSLSDEEIKDHFYALLQIINGLDLQQVEEKTVLENLKDYLTIKNRLLLIEDNNNA